ncbi:uncharacterized protein C17orf80 homolog [Onychostruthus taczanowskii]|uniref:uncharacterized protein C17orf80 homolog n=1 Tax=Onychostruthus taczanowskii TaxID=356909 RepID=UPI001B806B28|nr:uncharacterized protein C17orf80 homolog [Onychostruthus taczanowskii]
MAASPRPAPGSASRPAPGKGPAARPSPASAPGSSAQPSAASGSAPEPSPAADPRPAPGTGPAAPGRPSRAVRALARSLDLHPEEVRDAPRLLQQGVKVVIERHRARLVREKEPRSRGGGTERGPAPPKTAPKPESKEARGRGTAGSGSSEGEKSTLKATQTLQEPAESRNSPADLVQQEGGDQGRAGGERLQLEAGLGSEPPACALHPQILPLSLAEALAGHGPGTSRKELGLRGQAVPAPGLSPGRAPGPPLPRTPQTLPGCSARSAGTRAAGLEWLPELYPEPAGLGIFPGNRCQEDVRGTVETARGGLAQGQRGPLSERPLMEVRLGELHTWISTCSFSPQGMLGAVQRAWSSYCAKYIHVKQGGPAGISMLLTGYCLLSYGWNYQHFKRHRWRKYH